MRLNDKGLALVKQWEGCKLKAYKDGGGVWTIGYGHIEGVVPGMVWTQDQAEATLLAELSKYEKAVDQAVTVGLTENQFAALVVFTYNVGVNAFKSSTLLKKLNAGAFAECADQFLRWNRDNGVVVAGLTNRRNGERTLFLTP